MKNKRKIIALSLVASILSSNFASITYADVVDNKTEVRLLEKTTKDELNTRSILFNDGWKFMLGNQEGAEAKNFNDASWRNLDLPHDWSIEFDFNYNSPATSECGYLDGGTGWYRKSFVLPESMKDKQVSIDFGGVYMDSRTYVNGELVGNYPYGYMPFSYDIADKLVFDGVTENVIAVKVVNQLQSSRWYSGSGIYRDVHMTFTDKVHVDRYGTQITTPEISSGSGKVVIATDVENDTTKEETIKVRQTVLDSEGNEVSQKVVSENKVVPAKGKVQVEQNLVVETPKLWSTQTPNLYYVQTEVLKDNQVIDTYHTRFGFRYFEFTTDNGFYLNGEWTKLEGVCMHHDQGSLGAVANRSAIKRQMETMKEMGVNAIRVTHNPADDKLIAICEELGLMVIDEAFDTWTGKKSYDYGRFFNQKATHPDAGANMTWGEFDIKQMVERGKNSPAIIMWSIGNEITNTGSQAGVNTAKNLVKWVKEVDTTRPTTIGEDKFRGNTEDTSANLGNTYMKEVFNSVDVVGYNYSENRYDAQHNEMPTWKMYGSETASATSSRGVYAHPDNVGKGDAGAHPDYQQSAFDTDCVPWGRTAADSLRRDRDRKFIGGQFVWTGFDYIGEPTPWNQSTTAPPKSSYFGIVDTAGLEKDSFYLYQSQWTSVEEKPMVHVLPHWNWENDNLASKVTDANGKIPVRVYTNARSVELYFKPDTDTSEGIGTLVDEKKTFEVLTPYKNVAAVTDHKDKEYQETQDGKLYLEWRMNYTPGTITAIAYDKTGKEVSRDVVKTAKEAASVTLKPENNVIQADGSSISYVEVNITDESGTLVPTADNEVFFNVTGNGKIVGVDNGNAASHERYKDTNGVWKRKAFNGKAVVLVQSTKEAGSFSLTATSAGLERDTTSVYTIDSEVSAETILGYRMKPVVSILGEAVTLPKEVEAVYADGVTTKKLGVTWDTIPQDLLEKQGEFKVKGLVSNGDKVEISVSIIGILGIKDTTIVTTPGSIPQMPSKVTVVYSNGNQKEVAVTWPQITEDAVASVGEFMVEGTVSETTTLKAKAVIRISDEVEYTKNIATRVGNAIYPKPSASYNNVTDYITNHNNNMSSNINDGNIVRTPSWNNWVGGNGNAKTSWVQLEFEQVEKFGKVGIHFYTDGQTRKPQKITVETSVDGQDWTAVTNQDHIDDFGDAAEDWAKEYPISFDPVTAKYIRLSMDGQPSGNNFKPVGISELKVYGGTPAVGNTAKLSELKMNGQLMEDFSEDTYNYNVVVGYPYEIPEITAAASDHASVFVIPAMTVDHPTKIEVTSESGTTQAVYNVNFQKKPLQVSQASLSMSQTHMSVNTTKDITLVTKMEDDSILDHNLAVVTYDIQSDDGGSIQIKDGKVNAISAGTVRIKALITYQGITVESNSIVLTIEDSNEKPVVESYTLVEVNTKPGVAPVLPDKVTAQVKDSFDRELVVVWDSVSKEQYNEFGTFEVKGTVEGQSLRPIAKVNVKDIIGNIQFATATPVGVIPVLPMKTSVSYSDGTSKNEVPITWEAMNTTMFKVAEGTIVNVKGQVEVDGTILPVCTNVRVTLKDIDKTENLYQLRNGYELPFAVASYTNDGAASTDRVEKLNDGSISFAQTDAAGKNIWCNWNATARANDWVGVIMADEGVVTEKYVDTLEVGFFKEAGNGGVQYPESYKVEYYTGPLDFELPSGANANSPRGHIENLENHPFNEEGNWTEVTYTGEGGMDKPMPKDEEMTTITFDTVKSCMLRVSMVGKQGKSLGVTEIQAYGKVSLPKGEYEVRDIKVAGKSLENFTETQKVYEVELDNLEIPEIEVVTTNNAGITIIPATKGNLTAKIITIAENASVETQKDYVIHFKVKKTNLVELEKAIKKAEALKESDYEANSFKAMSVILKDAKKVLSDVNATQVQIDQATKKLNEAISSLKKKPVKKNEWIKDSKGWWYRHSDGSYTKNAWERIDGKWYHFDTRGYMQTGWLELGGTWYYLKNSGAMATGWLKESGTWYYLNASGKMQTGWLKENGTWYYLNASGKMQTGWFKEKSTWYYLNSNGKMATGWVKVKGTWYYMSGSGAMQTGWKHIKGKWYYMRSNGAMATGWTFDGKKTYYLSPITGAWNGQVK